MSVHWNDIVKEWDGIEGGWQDFRQTSLMNTRDSFGRRRNMLVRTRVQLCQILVVPGASWGKAWFEESVRLLTV